MHKPNMRRLTAIMLTAAVTTAPCASYNVMATTVISEDGTSAEVVRDSDETEAKIEEIKEQLTSVSSEIDELTAEKNEYVESMSERISYYYVHNSSGGVLNSILGSEDFADMLNSVAVEKELYDYNKEQLDEYTSLISDMEEKQASLNESLEEYYAILEEQEESEGLALNFVETALGMTGVPYVWGGTSSSGVDCSGFIYYCINNCGNEGWSIKRYTAEGLRKCSHVTEISKDELQPGDLIFFQGTYSTSGASHVAIYIGEGMMVHAAGSAVHITDINESYWVRHYMQCGRLSF